MVQKTPSLQNAGDSADWDNLYLEIESSKVGLVLHSHMRCSIVFVTHSKESLMLISSSSFLSQRTDDTQTELLSQSLTVDVYDHNTSGFHTLIGSTDVILEALLLKLGQEQELPMADIFDKDKKRAGAVKLFVKLDEPFQMVEEPLDQEALKAVQLETGGIVTINKIVCKSLTNVEMIGKNDPFCELRLGKQEQAVITTTKEDKGSDCAWDQEELTLSSVFLSGSKEELMGEVLTVSVFDRNSGLANTKIGEATISLAKLLLSLEEEVDLPKTQLKDKVSEIFSVSVECFCIYSFIYLFVFFWYVNGLMSLGTY